MKYKVGDRARFKSKYLYPKLHNRLCEIIYIFDHGSEYKCAIQFDDDHKCFVAKEDELGVDNENKSI